MQVGFLQMPRPSPPLSIASKTPSSEILRQSRKQMKVTWCEIRTVWRWCRHSQLRVAIWFCITVAECGLAMSSNNKTPDLRSPGLFFPNHRFQFRHGVTVPRSIDGSNHQKVLAKLNVSSVCKALSFPAGFFIAYQVIDDMKLEPCSSLVKIEWLWSLTRARRCRAVGWSPSTTEDPPCRPVMDQKSSRWYGVKV
ncbi:hypothetical protein TNCV_4101641 [Trichonephila clavipes]|nr:hypothetical protein TNCV_4101641 [Trichonephila clavipes]